MDNQIPPKKDRITLAWELRRDIHDWIKANPYCVMVEIFMEFPDRKRETVRKAVIKMRTDGDVAMLGRRGIDGSYSAISAQIKPASATRAKLAIGGLKTVHKLNASNEAKNKLRAAERAERKAERYRNRSERLEDDTGQHVEQIAPGHTRYRCGHTQPATDSRGQGAGRRTVHVNCSQNY